MTPGEKLVTPHFDISAAVVFRLGEELITDAVQALLELVKNSYDADATWVKVTVDTRAKNQWGREYRQANGVILVEDDGVGMDPMTIQRGWLTIANSPKREQKSQGRTTRRGRTPIGDKGLGRLGVQRLARNVEIFTRPAGEKTEHYVAFSWSDFLDTESLGEVPIVFESKESEPKEGTRLVLSDLREPEVWQSETSLQELQRKMSGMISPFQEVRDFLVHLEVDGKPVPLAEIAEQLRETALLKYSFQFDGAALHMHGMARLTYLQPSSKEDRALLRNLCRKDGGQALFEFLEERAGKRRPPVFRRSAAAGWFVEFAEDSQLLEMDKVKFVEGIPANPGPFEGEVDAVSLDTPELGGHALDRASDYRRLVRDLAGIRVYRDGFGIRVDEDWLGLGKQWTSGKSYYGLRPANVLGYVALTARDNPKLIETTSREGFQATPHYENLFGLLQRFVRFTGQVNEFLRRGVLQFLSEHRDHVERIQPEDTHIEITQRIDDVAGALATENKRLADEAGNLRNAAAKASETLIEIRRGLDCTGLPRETVEAALRQINEAISDVSAAAVHDEQLRKDLGTVLQGRASDLKGLTRVLERRWEASQEEKGALYESISLGLTAEALSHEIHNIADGLARRSSTILRAIEEGGVRKADVVAYIEHVRSSVAAMRKQLAHLTPSLRYLREQREQIDVWEFANEIAMFHNEKLANRSISIKVGIASGGSFSVLMNKGKLTQVFDNLIINAEYWLREYLRTHEIEKGEISIALEAPYVRVLDNGRGVEPSVEESLFEPFVTTKSSGQGRGLGLFVVQQLLDTESCAVLLLEERNAAGRRYVFELDFTGAIIA